MKLSEAIRAGAHKRPQVRGEYFNVVQRDDGSEALCSCALGAAFEGLTGAVTDAVTEVYAVLQQRFPLRVVVMHPVSGLMSPVEDVVMTLNDTYSWSRE